MDLTVAEAATILGVTPRTVRSRLARGELDGRKHGKRWVISRDALPLTEAQRRAVHARAQQVRDAVDQALPGRTGRTARTLLDLDAFRLGLELYGELRATDSSAAELLRQALLHLAEGVHVYARDHKLAALDQARASIGRASATLLLAAEDPADVAPLVDRLEGTVGPAISGYARWVAKLGRRSP